VSKARPRTEGIPRATPTQKSTEGVLRRMLKPAFSRPFRRGVGTLWSLNGPTPGTRVILGVLVGGCATRRQAGELFFCRRLQGLARRLACSVEPQPATKPDRAIENQTAHSRRSLKREWRGTTTGGRRRISGIYLFDCGGQGRVFENCAPDCGERLAGRTCCCG